jgi:putative sporulation protein YyaC
MLSFKRFFHGSISPKDKEQLRVHMEEPLSVLIMSNYITNLLEKSPKKREPVVVCIGTDRSTGDSLGPLTGWRLKSLLKNSGVAVYGTVDEPVHAVNIHDYLRVINPLAEERPIIAVDACLGQAASVGTILIENSSLRPGTGVNKDLPQIGDFGISGIVNVGGMMDYLVLQNTRLSLVLKMSQVISTGIFLALRKRKTADS